ncbi:hypothetical protein GCM10025792_30940 [Pseudonocardia tropica]
MPATGNDGLARLASGPIAVGSEAVPQWSSTSVRHTGPSRWFAPRMGVLRHREPSLAGQRIVSAVRQSVARSLATGGRRYVGGLFRSGRQRVRVLVLSAGPEAMDRQVRAGSCVVRAPARLRDDLELLAVGPGPRDRLDLEVTDRLVNGR